MTQCEFLLMYGYSGCDKTTILEQFAEKYPHYVYLIKYFSYLSPMDMIVEMGKCINIPIKRRKNEIKTLIKSIRYHPGIIFLFDEVKEDPVKLSILKKILEDAHVPIVICGIPALYTSIYDSRYYDDYCSITSRLEEHEMKGMRRSDSGKYLNNMVADKENITFTYKAQ